MGDLIAMQLAVRAMQEQFDPPPAARRRARQGLRRGRARLAVTLCGLATRLQPDKDCRSPAAGRARPSRETAA